MTRRIRQLVGLALLAWSSWTLIRATWSAVYGRPSSSNRLRRPDPRPVYGVELDTGAPTGLRISPLDPAETAAAADLETDLWRAWIAAT